jgi:hypothetical protein
MVELDSETRGKAPSMAVVAWNQIEQLQPTKAVRAK